MESLLPFFLCFFSKLKPGGRRNSLHLQVAPSLYTQLRGEVDLEWEGAGAVQDSGRACPCRKSNPRK